MPNYDIYNTDPYSRFLDWRNNRDSGKNYLSALGDRTAQPSRLTPDTTGQGNWQTGSNILTPQNAAGQGMSQVGEGKYVSNSLAKYYGQGGRPDTNQSNMAVTPNTGTEMTGPQRPTMWQGVKNNVINAFRGKESTSPNSFTGRMARFGEQGNTVNTAQNVGGTGMGGGGMAGYLGVANAIMGMVGGNKGSSQPVVSQPTMVNNPPPMGGSYSRGERRNRLADLPRYQFGGRVKRGDYIVGNEYDNVEGFLPELNPQNLRALGDGQATSVVGEAPDGQIIRANQAGAVVPSNVLAGQPEQRKPNFLNRIAGAFKSKEQPIPIPTDYNTPEGANYLNKLMAESQRKPTFTEKLPQALALLSGAFDPYGHYARTNANVIEMARQQEQERRQAPVNYLNQVMARSEIENIPVKQAYMKAQTRALERVPVEAMTPSRMAMLAAGGDPTALKALELSGKQGGGRVIEGVRVNPETKLEEYGLYDSSGKFTSLGAATEAQKRKYVTGEIPSDILSAEAYRNMTDEARATYDKVMGLKKASPGMVTESQVDAWTDQVVNQGISFNAIPRGARSAVITKIDELYPGFNIEEASSNIKYKQSPAIYNAIVNVNAVKPLIGELGTLFEEIGTTQNVPYNKVANWIKENTGNAKIVEFDAKRNETMIELTRALQGVGAMSDTRVKMAMDTLDRSYSPEQINAALKSIKRVLDARMEALYTLPYNPAGKPLDSEQAPILSPEAKAYYDTWGE